MTLHYKILKRAKPGKKSSEGMVYYPYPQRQGRFNLDEIAEQISKQSTMSEADVHGVLIALVNEITEKVSEGSIVELGRLGCSTTGHATLFASSADRLNLAEASAGNICLTLATIRKKAFLYLRV